MLRRVRLDPRLAAAVLRHVPPRTRTALRAAIRALVDDEAAAFRRLDVRELRAREAGSRAYRVRVGDWRIAFVVEHRDILVLRVFHRREGYAWLDRLDEKGPE